MNIHKRSPLAIAFTTFTIAAVVATAAPAIAAPPAINLSNFFTANGTFSKQKGVKSCTTTTNISPNNVPMQLHNGPFIATWLEDRTYALTTTPTLNGNGEVSSTSEPPVLLSRVAHAQTCTFVQGAVTIPFPVLASVQGRTRCNCADPPQAGIQALLLSWPRGARVDHVVRFDDEEALVLTDVGPRGQLFHHSGVARGGQSGGVSGILTCSQPGLPSCTPSARCSSGPA